MPTGGEDGHFYKNRQKISGLHRETTRGGSERSSRKWRKMTEGDGERRRTIFGAWQPNPLHHPDCMVGARAMGANIVVYDIETQRAFDEVGGREHFTKLGISLLGAFDYASGEFATYEEGELVRFEERLRRRPLLVGFNSRRFDTPILQVHLGLDLKRLPQLDLMEEMVKALGHRVSLESVASATLGEGKTGSGLDAIRYYREGRMEELKSYCLEDVRITRDLFEYGARHGELFYVPKFGHGRGRAPVRWALSHPEDDSDSQRQQSLF